MNPFDKVKEFEKEIETFKIEQKEQLEAFRIEYLGSKNKLKSLFGIIKDVANEEKKSFGQAVNAVKQKAEQRFADLKTSFEDEESKEAMNIADPFAPSAPNMIGGRHPLSIIRNEIIDIFKRLGFTVEENREIEDDFHNFTALNTPEDHPARDMTDTFYLSGNLERVLRSHTSTVQVRTMESQKPPIRIISPGRVYRNETISARAHCIFHQVEVLYVDENVSFSDLKQTMDYFVKELFGEKSEIRLRPSFFPFTEPSAEVDVSCFICQSKGCPVCKHTNWVEILGCGMIDPNVLENCGIDSKKYSGFALGMGIERIAMLKYRLGDIRNFFENDIRFLKQFESA